MALFAAIGDRFIAKILRQVASDYNLDFDEMKSRYCGDTSFELSEPVKKPELPAKVPTKVAVKPKVPKVPKVDKVAEPKALQAPHALTALSKMKKPDLVRECEERDLDSEGTVSQLKDRIKEARIGTVPVKAAPKPKKEKSPPPPPPPVPLEEEPGDEVEEEAEEEVEDDLQARLRKILAEAEEDEFEEEEDSSSS